MTSNFFDKSIAIDDSGNHLINSDLDYLNEKFKGIIGERKLLFSLSNNTIGSLCGYLSFYHTKNVPLLLDATIDLQLFKELMEKYKPNFLWVPAKRDDIISKYDAVFEKYGFVLLRTSFGIKHKLFPELALLLTTSGSTGSPKLVRVTYKNIISNANSIGEYLGITQDEKPITSLPMYYSFGLSVINSHILKGATILLTNRSIMEKEFWQFLNDHQATSLAGVPFTYKVLKKLRFFKMELPSLKTLLQAGGKLSEDLVFEFANYCKSRNKKFFVMYGQTEATARMSYLPSESVLDNISSIGIPIPDGEFQIVDENGKNVDKANVLGELVYKGDNVTLGYAESYDDLSKGDENKGVLFTGDLAKRDGHGFYHIVGRKKRFIKIFGNRINLDEVEQLIKTIVDDVACVGEDDNMIIYTTHKNYAQEIRSFISLKTGLNHSAFLVKEIDEIPLNSSGKILYSALTLN
ncbi:AMP-binding protein [Flavobacterium aquiphilum]|uniref:AMP-binding protein n=1 Tax=Flavobacterium aquiphilum TaxID=3003261 RepID=UPI0024808120|nr:AMP-binding protein [Flavobacterium aquiphilum]